MAALISVLIPTFEYGRFIADAIDSVLAQTYPDVEVVVCDNASTDGTAQLVAARYGADPRVRLVCNERNIGLVPNFNRALTEARGEYVLWLSADDWLLPDHLRRLHAVFARDPAVDVVYTTVYFADGDGNVYAMRSDAELLPFDYIDVRDELPEMLTGAPAMVLPATLFRRALFDEVGAMDETVEIAADWELAVRLALAGKRFAYVAEPSACVRVHGANASGRGFNRTGRIVVETTEIVAKFLDHPGMARVHGREAAIARRLEGLYAAKLEQLGPEAFEPGFTERLGAVCAALRERDARYEPASVTSARISVIVPVLGPPGPALRALDALAAQTFPAIEIVLVDQSPIPLRELLRDHAAADRIVYARLTPARRAGAARNFGMRLARGAFVAFLDEDNVVAPEHFALLAATIARTGAHAAAAAARLVVELTDQRFITADPVAVVGGLFRGAGDPLALGAVANALPLNAILQDRGAYEHAGGFSEDAMILEDFDYLGRLTSVHQLAFSPVATLDVHVRLGLHAQALGIYAARYLETLDAIYAARTVDPAVAGLRLRHRAAVAAALAKLPEIAHTPPGVVELLSALAGRNVIPASSAAVVESNG
jgi:glycosyltransferase involved in cell wall biosynthesis